MYQGSNVLDEPAEILDTSTITLPNGIMPSSTGGSTWRGNAFSDRAVGRLRQLKKREGKLLPVFFRDLNSRSNMQKYLYEEAALCPGDVLLLF